MVGTTVSHYRVLQLLGAGGMGVVYLAEDQVLQRKVALKFLSPALATDATARARFNREAQSASALDHANIGTVYEIGEWNGQPFIAMAYYDGETLKQRIDRGPMELREVARVVADIGAGLAAAHAAEIVHRDLKPANILLTRAGPAKILDFGLAKMMSADLPTAAGVTGSGTTVGTVAYMAPEQAQGQAVDHRADVWALGVVLYEMLTGRLPFTADNVPATLLAIISQTPTPVKELRADVPPELERIVGRALQRDRVARTITASEVVQEVAAYLARASSGTLGAVTAPSPWAWLRQARVAIPVALALVTLVSGGAWAWNRNAKVRWAHDVAIPESKRLADEAQFFTAFGLVEEAGKYIAGDQVLAGVRMAVSRPVTIDTQPQGAEVYYKPYYADAAVPWTHLGTSPIKDVAVPRGVLRLKIEKNGWATVEDALPPYLDNTFSYGPFSYVLDEQSTIPPGMVRASTSGAPFKLYVPGYDHLPAATLNDYWIDKFEVTNGQYKQFVASGGYAKREFWRQEFLKDGKAIPWEQAVSAFTDTTGRPGPATWEAGGYPAGRDDYPVTGVSWYEAAAYAEYAGKALPTVLHWSGTATQNLSGDAVPFSNFGSRGLDKVGMQRAVHRFGALDMAGNAKEWCWNLANSGQRFILGGAWDEPGYLFVDPDARSPWERAANFGFRCMKYFPNDTLAADITGPLEVPSRRDYSKETPVSDEVFRAYARLYAYDKTDLKATTEAVDDANDDWRREKVTFSAAYGNERVIAYLFLPKHSSPPFQTVVFFPGSDALSQRSSEKVLSTRVFDFLIADGRAVLFPVYKSTFERGDGMESDVPNSTTLWRDHVVMWSKDLGRSIDYLETRPDIDRARLAFYGFSWGGQMGGILPAVEPRLKASVIYVGGFDLRNALPEVEPINFAPRITIPTLMLNGLYDFFIPAECCQESMFRLLWAPPEHKRRVVYQTGHNVPRPELIKETLNWLDKYLGPVK
jgi:tRNA A-37 threonylcarbamoyl transferase component Bud32/dienelactone hydrolase